MNIHSQNSQLGYSGLYISIMLENSAVPLLSKLGEGILRACCCCCGGCKFWWCWVSITELITLLDGSENNIPEQIILKLHNTVRKFHKFSITKILREINCRGFCHFDTYRIFMFMNFCIFQGINLPNWKLSKPQKWQNRQF